ncbi:MAG: stage II sporulation protein M [Pirellulaceae bacterium]
MKAADIIQRREIEWAKLEGMCEAISQRKSRQNAQLVNEFAALYRNACADLALASANQFPPGTVDYLHSLVAKAHNQLYRSRAFQLTEILMMVFHDTPRRIFSDPCVHVAGLIFWGLFGISAWLSYEGSVWPNFASGVMGDEALQQMETTFEDFEGRTFSENMFMAAFYVFNNAGIGLRVFVSMLPILPGLILLGSNAVQLGAAFGHMLSPDSGIAGDNFKNFVTAHGPFELTAIVLSAGAGLRIGISWLATNNLRRLDSLQVNAKKSMPIALCAVAFFFIAAFIEGFISPAPETMIPWFVKAAIAVLSSGLMMFYFVILGYPWRRR